VPKSSSQNHRQPKTNSDLISVSLCLAVNDLADDEEGPSKKFTSTDNEAVKRVMQSLAHTEIDPALPIDEVIRIVVPHGRDLA